MVGIINFLLDPKNNNFLLFSHTSPDGDTLGSALALNRILKKLGKESQVICDSSIPSNLQNIPCVELIKKKTTFKEYIAVAIDVGGTELLGKNKELFFAAKFKIVIDHHCTNTGFGDLNYIHPEAAATGEIIWQLAEKLEISMDKDIAELLYVAISTDTGNFSYSNTTPETLRISAKILEVGFNLAKINEQLFRERTYFKTKLIGLCIENIELHLNESIGISCITLEQLKALKVGSEDTEGLVDFIRDIKTVNACAFIHETSPNIFKVSFRSKGEINVSNVAKVFGGGGHRASSGCKLEMTDQEAKAKILEELKKEYLLTFGK